MTNARTNPTEQQAAAQATKPTFFVINDVLYYQAKAGDELKFDLDFDGEVMDKIDQEGDELSERKQFFLMLGSMQDGKTLTARVQKMGALEQTRLMVNYFAQFTKAAGATLGESGGSSDS